MDDSEVSLISIPVDDRQISIKQYLPYISYLDISDKIPQVSQHLLSDMDDLDQEVQGVIFFGPAMAVRQGYYRYFLDYLSNQGYLVFSFDFSGIDTSKAGSLKGSDLTMDNWITDLQTAVDWTLQHHKEILEDKNYRISPKFSQHYLCHSLGGQFFGFLSNQNSFEKMVGITSQNGYWRLYNKTWRYFFFWYLLVPVLISLFGYFPSKRVGFGEDLPPNIMRRWKKWCTLRNYFFDDDDFNPNYEEYKQSILTIGFTDDPWATSEAIEDLYQHYNNANRDHWMIDPSEIQAQEIGHMGFFRPKSITLWQRLVEWLQ